MGAREVHQTGEGHVPSMRNCCEVQEQANHLRWKKKKKKNVYYGK